MTSIWKIYLNIALNHEQQHQELILMDIKHILYSNIDKPTFIKEKKVFDDNLKKKKRINLY